MTSFYDFNWIFIISTDFAKNPLQRISQKRKLCFGTRFFHEDRSHDKLFTVAHIMEVDWVCVVLGRKLAGCCEHGYEHSGSRRRRTSLQ
jgi:hypothetical protein